MTSNPVRPRGEDKGERGFLLVEVLLAILILSTAITAFLGSLSQVLRVTRREIETTQAILPLEHLLFELEIGERSDLLSTGGAGKIGGVGYAVLSKAIARDFRSLNIRVGSKNEREILKTDVFLSERPPP